MHQLSTKGALAIHGSFGEPYLVRYNTIQNKYQGGKLIKIRQIPALIGIVIILTMLSVNTAYAERSADVPQVGESISPQSVSIMSNGGIVTDSTPSSTDLVNTLLGGGVTISNVQFTGANIAAGTFSGGTGIIGFESGIILSSGDIANVIGPNIQDGITADNNLVGDSDLDALIPGYTTYDATVLEFDFVPATDQLQFKYVFSSDEYNEYVNTEYNDAFGFFVNGQNIALIPTTTTPVAINNVNCGGPIYGTDPSNCLYYINNDLDDSGGLINTEMDGLTVVFTATASVNPGVVNHIKLAIADAGDYLLDSNVFIEAESFVSPQLTLEPKLATNYVGESHQLTATLVDECVNPVSGETITFTVTSGPHIGMAGTDTTDNNGIATWSYTGTTVGTDTIIATGYGQTSIEVYKIWEPAPNLPPEADAGLDQVVEQDSLGGASVTLDGSGSSDDGKIAPLTYTWTWSGGSPTGVNPTVTLPMGLTEVTLTVYDGEYSDTDTVDITVLDTTAPVITCPVDVTVEQATADGTEVELEATVTDICDADPTITSDAPAIFPLGPTTVTFTATDDSGNSASCSMTVTVVDTNAPEVACLETVNPHGNTIPGGKNDKNTNEDGFYELAATDICDAEPELYLMSIDVEATDDLLGAFDISKALGPYPSGYKVKYTEANGATEISEKKIGSDNGQADAIDSHVKGPHDLVVFAMDDAGNLGVMTCLVPPPPK